MTNYFCVQCGVQFAESAVPPSRCPICEDERQYVRWEGQAWLTPEELAAKHRLAMREDMDVLAFGIEPRFAIGQRALLAETPHGNVLWDCVSLVSEEAVTEINRRGGLQAIPKGQYEGADSLGLGYWQKTRLIIMPQALKLVIPGIVNTFIGMFKDTTLVLIISMFDLLGIVKQNLSDANWATPQTAKTGLVFAAVVFWMFCFGMSRYSMYMERRLDTGHKR